MRTRGTARERVVEVNRGLGVGLVVVAHDLDAAVEHDGSQVNIGAGAQVVKDTGADGVGNKLLGLLKLESKKENRARQTFISRASSTRTSRFGLQRASKTAMAASEPEPIVT